MTTSTRSGPTSAAESSRVPVTSEIGGDATARRRRDGNRAARVVLLGLVAIASCLQECAVVTREAKMEFIRVRSRVSSAEVEITLENGFIEIYKNRVTIDVPFTVDRTDRHPHPPFLDGDFHVSGRAPDIGLPIVAEVKNSSLEPEVVRLLRGSAGTGQPLRLVGVWRLWLEHVGRAPEVQGDQASPIELTDPDHVFEIHPVLAVDDHNMVDSLHLVPGYRPPRADAVFRILQGTSCRIIPKYDTTIIVTEKGQFNDVDFVLEVGEDPPQTADDGTFRNAAVLDVAGHRLVEKVRMVLPRGTRAERAVVGLQRGQRVRAFGLPRIDLAEIARRTEHSREDPGLLNLTLPYEIIVVGVYDDRL